LQKTFNVQHSTLNIQHSTFNTQHSTPNIQGKEKEMKNLTQGRKEMKTQEKIPEGRWKSGVLSGRMNGLARYQPLCSWLISGVAPRQSPAPSSPDHFEGRIGRSDNRLMVRFTVGWQVMVVRPRIWQRCASIGHCHFKLAAGHARLIYAKSLTTKYF